MATATELKQVLLANKDKRATAEYAELYERYRRKRREEYSRPTLREEPGFLDQLEELAKGVPAGIIGLGELGALGAAALLDEEEELKVRSGIQSVAKSLKSPFTADAGSEELVGRKFGEALGSFVGLGLTSLIPGAGMPAAAGLAMGAGAGEASERARAAGATERERATAALKGTVVGATELIPLGKLRELRASLGDNAFLNGIERIKRAAVAGGFEGAQEAAAGVLQNAIQRGYDPTQDLVNLDVAEEGGYGAAVGATVQALLDLATPRTRGDLGGQSGISEEESAAVLAELEKDEDATRTKLEEEKEGEGIEVSDADIEEVTGVKTKTTFTKSEEKLINKIVGLYRKLKEGDSLEVTLGSLTDSERKKFNTNRINDEVKRRLKTEVDTQGQVDTEEVGTEEVDTEGQVVAETGRAIGGDPLQYHLTEYSDALQNDPGGGEVFLNNLIDTGEISSEDADAIRNAYRAQQDEETVGIGTTATIYDLQQELSKEKIGTAKEREEKVIAFAVDIEAKALKEGRKNLSEISRGLDTSLLSFSGLDDFAPVDPTMSIDPSRVPAVKKEILRRLAELDATEGTGEGTGEGTDATLTKLEGTVTTAFKDADPITVIKEEDNTKLQQAEEQYRELIPAREARKGKEDQGLDKFVPKGYIKERGGLKKLESVEAAGFYLDKYDNLESAVRAVAYERAAAEKATGFKDIGVGTFTEADFSPDTPTVVKEFFMGSGGPNANKAYKWFETELAGVGDLQDRLKKEYKDAQKVMKGQLTAAESRALQKTADKGAKAELEEQYKTGQILRTDLISQVGELLVEEKPYTDAELKKLDEGREAFKKTEAANIEAQKRKDKAFGAGEVREASAKEIEQANKALVAQGASESDVVAINTQIEKENLAAYNALDTKQKKQYEEVNEKILALEGELAGDLDAETYAKKQKSLENNKKIRGGLLKTGRKKAKVGEGYRNIPNYRTRQRKGDAQRRQDEGDPERYIRDPYHEEIPEPTEQDLNEIRINGLPVDVVSEFTQPLHRGTTSLLANNDLEGALNSVSASSANIRLKSISKKFAALAGDTKVEIVKDLKDPRNQRPLAGLFDPRTNTIKLDSVVGLNEHTLVHEMAHALGSANIQAFLDGKLKLKTNAAASRLVEIYNNTKDLLGSAYGAEDVHEFFAEAAGNEEFRMELARIHPKGSPKSALEQVVEWFRNIVKRLLGWDSVTLKEVDTLIDALISPAPMHRDAEILAMDSTVKGAEKELKGLGAWWRWLSTRPTEQGTREWVNGVEQVAEDLGSKVIRTFFGAIDLPGIAELSKKVFGSIGKNLQVTAEKQRGAMEIADKRADIVSNHVIKFKENKPKEYNRLNEIIYSREYGATINQVDPLIEDKSTAEKKYGGDPEKLAAWVKLNKEWEQLSDEGQRTYKILRNFYRREFKSLKDTLYNRLKAVSNEDIADAANAAGVNNKVLDALFSDKVLDVYFPLARQGRFKIEYTLKNVPDGYAMEMVDTKAEARAIKQQLQENEDLIGEPEIVDTREPFSGAYRAPPIRFIEEILRKVDQRLGYSEIELSAEQLAVREGVRSKIVEVFIASLPETSFAKSLAKRKNTPGYEADVLFALKTKGYDLGRQVARIEYTRQVSALESELIEKYKTLKGDDSTEYNSALYAELMERASFIRNPPVDQYAQLANQGAFIYTIGFNVSSALVNLSQLPLFAFPYLAGEYQNTPSAFNEIMKASSFVGSSFKNYDVGIDNYYMVDIDGNYRLNQTKLKELTEGLSKAEAKKKERELTNLMPLVQMAAARGQLTKSFLIDELSLQREAGKKGGRARSGGVFRQALDKITGISAMGFNVAERFNRQSTMVAAYNLELNRISKGKDNYTFTEEQLAEAADKALYMTQETNGGAFRETGPRLSQQGLLRVALMYKTYGFRMYQTMIKSGIRAIKGTKFSDDPKENARLRSVAIRQLIGFHATSALFAGVYGIPLYGAISMAFDAYLDDEEDDFDNMVRKQIGEIPYKGIVNEILGVDVASRIRLSGLLIQSNKYNANASAEETIGFYMGGPALSTAKRFGRGINYLSEGEIERGIENMLPAGISNFMKASPVGRVYREGYSTQRGDPIYDDVTTGELASQMFGFAPLEYIRRIEENQNAKGVDDTIKRRRSKLLKRLYISMRTSNASDRADARKEIIKFNKRHPRYAINYTSIKRSIKAHQRTSATMHNGVVLSPQMRTILRQMREGE